MGAFEPPCHLLRALLGQLERQQPAGDQMARRLVGDLAQRLEPLGPENSAASGSKSRTSSAAPRARRQRHRAGSRSPPRSDRPPRPRRTSRPAGSETRASRPRAAAFRARHLERLRAKHRMRSRRRSGHSAAIDSAIAPEPVPRSRTRGRVQRSASARRTSSTASTRPSVSGRGIRTPRIDRRDRARGTRRGR